MTSDATPGNALLACRPERDGDSFVFPYTLLNRGGVDMFVMDALPAIDPQTLEARADPLGVTVALGGDGLLHILRGLAPLPRDRHVARRALPLAVRLAPGATVQRRLVIPAPLVEGGPYHPDLPVREYDIVEASGVVLAVDYLRATAEGAAAAACEFSPLHVHVAAPRLAAQMQRVSLRIPARALAVLKRRDAFPRPGLG